MKEKPARTWKGLVRTYKNAVEYTPHGVTGDTVIQKPSGRKKRHIKETTTDLMEKKERRKKCRRILKVFDRLVGKSV